jgi:hypothetical protein
MVSIDFKSNTYGFKAHIANMVRKEFELLGFKTNNEPCYCSGATCSCQDFIIKSDQYLN